MYPFLPVMIVHNGTRSSVLAGSLMGVLDNCFTVGWAGERKERGRREERERKVEGKKAEGRAQPAEDRKRENREWGHLSLLLIGY